MLSKVWESLVYFLFLYAHETVHPQWPKWLGHERPPGPNLRSGAEVKDTSGVEVKVPVQNTVSKKPAPPPSKGFSVLSAPPIICLIAADPLTVGGNLSRKCTITTNGDYFCNVTFNLPGCIHSCLCIHSWAHKKITEYQERGIFLPIPLCWHSWF